MCAWMHDTCSVAHTEWWGLVMADIDVVWADLIAVLQTCAVDLSSFLLALLPAVRASMADWSALK
jgi:hypothetical protein